MSGWIRQMFEDDVWRDRADHFPPKPLSPFKLTRGEYIAAKYWRDRMDLYAAACRRSMS